MDDDPGGTERRAKIADFMRKRQHNLLGQEVMTPGVPAQHIHSLASDLIPGDGIHHEGQSWVIKDIRDHKLGRTAVVEPRKGLVGRTVMSTMQFGVEGITMEDTDERAFTFHPDQVVARRG